MTHKLNARMAGILILLATVTFITGSAILDPLMASSDLLTEAASNHTNIILGVLLEYVDAFAVVGVAIFLYPLITRYNTTQAISYVVFRTLEGVLLLVSGVMALVLIPLSGASDVAGVALLPAIHSMSFQVAMLALGLGSIPFCLFLFNHRLIPAWLSLAGVAGYIALAASTVFVMFGNAEIANYLYVPGALFEIIFPLWLIVKGLPLPANAVTTPAAPLVSMET